jgi:hypothetical protein
MSIPASRRRSSPRPRMSSFGSSTPITTLASRRSITRSTHSRFGALRAVQGSRVVKSVAPAINSSPSFFSSSVNSACSPASNSPRKLPRLRRLRVRERRPPLGKSIPPRSRSCVQGGWRAASVHDPRSGGRGWSQIKPRDLGREARRSFAPTFGTDPNADPLGHAARTCSRTCDRRLRQGATRRGPQPAK